MIVKNISLDNFKPTVCVPIVDNNINRSLETARLLSLRKVPVIEWRLDCLTELGDKDKVFDGVKQFADICKNTITIVTIRTKEQGGNASIDESQLRLYLSYIARNSYADFIDVEYFTYERPKSIIESLKSLGANIICSNHEFDETPEDEMLLTMLEEMESSDCDGVKIAVMPSKATDVTRFMDVCNAYACDTKKLFISMAMGDLGRITRLAGSVTGSALTFGSYNKASAPGQIEYQKLEEILNM